MLEDLPLPTARDWIIPCPFDLSPDDDLHAALDQMVKHRASAAPVLDGEGKLVGMLTEKDCLRVLSSAAYEGDIQEGTVADFHSPVALSIEPQMDIFRVAELFLANNFPVLPVVEDGHLIGQVSRQSVLEGIQMLRAALDDRQKRFESEAGHQADRPRSIESMQRLFANARNRDQLVRQIGRKH